MQLPQFRSSRARKQEGGEGRATRRESSSDRTLTPTDNNGVNIKRATKARKIWILISCFCFTIATIFLLLVVSGNINQRPVIRSTYFFRLDLANIIPVSTGSSIQLVNSLARSLGLHDYYLVGMWNFCEGYNDEGVVYCSPPQTLYWFNPVEILLNELLSGATIVLPADINDILELIRLASNLMFGFFLTGLLMNFVSIFLAPLAIYSRWWSLPLAIWTFITALLSTAATIIATVMFIIFRNTITSQEGINIGAELGNVMFGFMWTGAAFSIFGFVIHLGMSCCCASRRDVRTGRRKGSKKAYASKDGVMRQEKSAAAGSGKGRMGWMRRKKTSGQVV